MNGLRLDAGLGIFNNIYMERYHFNIVERFARHQKRILLGKACNTNKLIILTSKRGFNKYLILVACLPYYYHERAIATE